MQEAGNNPSAMRACMDRFFPGLTSCLIEAVGIDRFNAISSGAARPTAEEMEKGQSCFGKLGFEPPHVTTAPHASVSSQVESCLKQVLGDARIEALKTAGGAGITFEEQQKAQTCFGPTAASAPMEPPKQIQLDTATVSCLKSAIGEARYNAISSGEAVPTEAEMSAGQSCFGTKPTGAITPQDVLVPAAEAVPYLPEKPQAVDLSSVTSSATGTSVTVEGTAEPGSTVDIHLYSEPTAVRTQAGSNGKFSIKLEKSFQAGNHLAYATTKSNGQTVRSGGEKFAVGTPVEQAIEKAKEIIPANLWPWLLAASAGVVAVAVFFLWRWWRTRLP